MIRQVSARNCSIPFNCYLAKRHYSTIKNNLNSTWSELLEKHFLQKDYNKKPPEIHLNQGNPQRATIINMINSNEKLFKIARKFPQISSDEFLICLFIEKNPNYLFRLEPNWKFNENVLKSACKNFEFQSDVNLRKLKNLIEAFIEMNSYSKNQAINFRNELIVLQPKLIQFYIKKEKQFEKRLGEDEEFIRIGDIVARNGLVIEYIPHSSQYPGEVYLLDAIKQNGLALQFLDVSYLKDKKILNLAITQNPKALLHCFRPGVDYATFPFYSSKYLLSLFRRIGFEGYQCLPDIIRMRSELILEALKYNGLLLQYVPEEVRKQHQLYEQACQIALESNVNALQFVSDEFQLRNRALIEKCLSLNVGETLQYCHSNYLNDKEFITKALKELRKDDSLSAGLSIFGNLLKRMKSANSELLQDQDIIYEIFVASTIILNIDNIDLVNDISKDKLFIEKASIDHKKWFIYAISHNLINEEYMKKLINRHGFSSDLPDSILHNQEWAKLAIEQDFNNIKVFPIQLVRDLCSKDSHLEGKLLELINTPTEYLFDDRYLINYLSDSKRNNKEFCKEKLQSCTNSTIFDCFHINLRNDPEIVLFACLHDPLAITKASRELLSSITFVNQYLERFPQSVNLLAQNISENLLMNKELVMKMLRLKMVNDSNIPSDPLILELIMRNRGNPLRNDPELIQLLSLVRIAEREAFEEAKKRRPWEDDEEEFYNTDDDE